MMKSLKTAPEMMQKHSWALTGTTIFAFLNVITASTGLLICLNVLALYVYEAITHTDKIDAFMWSACLSTNFIAALSLVFAVILHLGMNRRKPCFVLAYLIFGTIIEISIICTLVALYQDSDSYLNKKLREVFCEYYDSAIYATVGICVGYAFLLTMVCWAWLSIKPNKRSADKVVLVNDYFESDWRTD